MMNRDLRILTKTRGSNAQWFRVCSAPAENPPFSSSTHTWQCTTKCNSSSRWFSALFWHLWATAFTWHIFRYINRSNNNEHGMLEITWTRGHLIPLLWEMSQSFTPEMIMEMSQTPKHRSTLQPRYDRWWGWGGAPNQNSTEIPILQYWSQLPVTIAKLQNQAASPKTEEW